MPHHKDPMEEKLRSAAAADLSSAAAPSLFAAAEARRFLDWLDDGLPLFSDEIDGDDKFAALIGIARDYPVCNEYFLDDVGVNPSTVWRWSTKKSRPSRFVGKRLAAETSGLLIAAVVRRCVAAGLVVV